MDTARLPQVYLSCKDCVSIKLGAVLSSFFIAAILLWEKDDVGFVLSYSVIYNSVGIIK